jgi:hypothetical protein
VKAEEAEILELERFLVRFLRHLVSAPILSGLRFLAAKNPKGGKCRRSEISVHSRPFAVQICGLIVSENSRFAIALRQRLPMLQPLNPRP